MSQQNKTNRRLTTTGPTKGHSHRHHKREKKRNSEVYKCALCNDFHALRFCRKFLKMTVKRREEIVEEYRYRENCLAKSHELRACLSKNTCRKCDRYHHTLLHPTTQRAHQSKGIKTKDLRHRQHQTNHRQTQLNSRMNQPQDQPTTSTTTTLSAAPDAKVIVETIRSLAQVLCVRDKPSPTV